MMDNRIEISAKWDAEASVWYVEECSVAGLVTEAATLDELMEKVAQMAVDLREDEATMAPPIPVHLQALREPLVV